MLCCFDYPSGYNTTENDGVSPYPGLRRTIQHPPNVLEQLVPTEGNALMAYDPSKDHGVDGQLISVTVPEGVQAGQTIHVASPDGSNQLIATAVPQGMSPGSVFMVQLPPTGMSASCNNQSHGMTATTFSNNAPDEKLPVASEVGSKVDANTSYTPPPVPSPQFQSAEPTNTPATDQKELLLLVKVPPEVAAGSMIHVQVPGENRMLAAQVPHGVREFHVSYTPQQNTPATGQQSNQSGQAVTTSDQTSSQNASIMAGAGLMAGAGAIGYAMLNNGNQENNED